MPAWQRGPRKKNRVLMRNPISVSPSRTSLSRFFRDFVYSALDHMPERYRAVARRQSEAAPHRDLWVSLIAAGSVIFAISGSLLLLTVELRSGWVSEHEVKMDKATAIHNLLFRR